MIEVRFFVALETSSSKKSANFDKMVERIVAKVETGTKTDEEVAWDE